MFNIVQESIRAITCEEAFKLSFDKVANAVGETVYKAWGWINPSMTYTLFERAFNSDLIKVLYDVKDFQVLFKKYYTHKGGVWPVSEALSVTNLFRVQY